MPKTIELPLDPQEGVRVLELVKAYRELPGHAYAAASEDSILRMIFTGGIFKNKDRETAQRLTPPPTLSARSLTSDDATLADLAKLSEKWKLSTDEVLRIVVVDGLAYVEEALDAFQRGHKTVPAKGSA